MLIRDDGDSWVAIPQPAHALLSGEIARVWGNAKIAAPERRQDLCLGAEQHDVAWTDWDLRPPLNATSGRAASFYEAPFRERLAIWADAPRRVLAQSPYAALIVSLHGTNIHTIYIDASSLPPPEAALVCDYLDGQHALQEQLLAALGVDREHATRAGELVFCLDAISLCLCHDWPERELPPVDGIAMTYSPAGPGEATLDPWPLSVDRLPMHLFGRRLTARFSDERTLHAALAEAPLERFDMLLRRAGTAGTSDQ